MNDENLKSNSNKNLNKFKNTNNHNGNQLSKNKKSFYRSIKKKSVNQTSNNNQEETTIPKNVNIDNAHINIDENYKNNLMIIK